MEQAGLTTERNICGTVAFPQGARSLSEKRRNAASPRGMKLCSLGQVLISLLREYCLWLWPRAHVRTRGLPRRAVALEQQQAQGSCWGL